MRNGKLGKAALTAPLYISVAWSLIISYQVFTQTAVTSIINSLNGSWPSIGQMLISRIDTIAFIHAFAWIFVLASVIPTVILGKGRSVLLQFLLCLTATFVAVSIEEILPLVMGTDPIGQLQPVTILFQNPLTATAYLSIPYLFMVYIDFQSRRKSNTVEPDEEEGPQELEQQEAETVYWEEETLPP